MHGRAHTRHARQCTAVPTGSNACILRVLQDVLHVLLPAFLQRTVLQASHDGDPPAALPAERLVARTETEEAASTTEGKLEVAVVAAAATRVTAEEGPPAAAAESGEAATAEASPAAEGLLLKNQAKAAAMEAEKAAEAAAATEAAEAAEAVAWAAGARSELPLQVQAAHSQKSKKKKQQEEAFFAAAAVAEPSKAPPAAVAASPPAAAEASVTPSPSVRVGKGFQAEVPPYEPDAPDDAERNDVLETTEFVPLTAPPNRLANGAAAPPSPY